MVQKVSRNGEQEITSIIGKDLIEDGEISLRGYIWQRLVESRLSLKELCICSAVDIKWLMRVFDNYLYINKDDIYFVSLLNKKKCVQVSILNIFKYIFNTYIYLFIY